jgi:hypothetical protein
MICPAHWRQQPSNLKLKMGLNKQEILVLSKSSRGNYSIEIKSSGDGIWQAGIRMNNPQQYFDVFTSRGDLKTWKNLADAIFFFQETCEDCKEISIVVKQWIFERRS